VSFRIDYFDDMGFYMVAMNINHYRNLIMFLTIVFFTIHNILLYLVFYNRIRLKDWWIFPGLMGVTSLLIFIESYNKK
jgi:hypothetical protein